MSARVRKKAGATGSAADAAAGAARSPRAKAPVWEVRSPVFAADEVCPLMPVWPWGGHRGWAYDLVRFMKPRVIGELGVHWGTSLFAFAQAVKDGKLKSRLIGVDTWRGDNHTGPYGTEVLGTVREIAERFFPKISFEFLPMTFDEALPLVADESIDLLHVDGFHEYEAVEHDFTTWLPKLAPDGVVLLHDVADSTGYGSASFWRDLAAKYPAFAFEHSWGLGVVFPKGDRWKRAMDAQNLADKVRLYTYRARLERATLELKDTGDMAVSRLAAMDTMGGIIRDRDNEISLLKGIVRDREGEVGVLRGTCEELQGIAGEVGSLRAASAEALSRCERLGVQIEEMEGALRRTGEIAARVPELEERIAGEVRRGDAAESDASAARARIVELSGVLTELEGRHASTVQSLDASRAESAALALRVEEVERQVAALSGERDRLVSRVGDVEHRHDVLGADMRAMKARIREQHLQAEALRAEASERDAMMQQLKETMERVSADMEMIALRVEQLERLELEREKRAEDGREAVPARAVRPAGPRSRLPR